MEEQEQTVKVKVQTLTQEAFRPYGQALESKQPIFPEVEPGEGRVAIEMQKMKRPVNPRRISGMAIHFSYNQTFIPVHGTMALIVAPPPRNRDAGHEKYELDYERIAAFFVEPGQAAFIEKGMFHKDFLIAERFDDLDYSAQRSIYELVELHAAKTSSSCANVLLTQWDKLAKNLIRLTPKTQA